MISKERIGMFAAGVLVVVMVSAMATSSSASTNSYQTNQSTVRSASECETVVSALLDRKQHALERRERTIVTREDEIRAAEERTAEKLQQIQDLRDELREYMKDMDEVQKAEVIRLTGMMEKMRGKQAAAILEQTERKLAVEVLRSMDKSRAGKAMAAMKPEIAAEISELMTLHAMQVTQ